MKVKNIFNTIDTHTEGGPTRIITSGIPVLSGKTMKEKMDYFQSNLDHLRRVLMLEPRGRTGMFGAVITESTESQADAGVFFLTSSGYLSMCVHSAIGVGAAFLETGIIQQSEEKKVIKLDTPAGLIDLEPKYSEEKLESLAIQTNPAFVHTDNALLDIGSDSPLKVSLVFSAVFFVLLDMKQLGMKVAQDNIPELVDLGVKVLEAANRSFKVSHPEHPDIKTIELALLYEEIEDKRAVNAVISRTGSLDRSPCGAGTGAKMAYLLQSDKLKLNEQYINEGVYGTKFTGQLIKAVHVGSYKGAIPRISGSAFITGIHQFILDEHDPFQSGF
ncbi:MAG: proline racemase family protein [Candidatus Aminicenantes bacterium]|nr:MAG: proline racemase family protein [Candidatus Aminicenantes bacterium]